MSHHKLSTPPLRSLLRRSLVRTAAGTLGAAAPFAVLANPTGGQVAAGNATIGAPSTNGLVINQSSKNAVINWQQFSVGKNQYVQFIQPSSSSVVLNRVTGGTASQIFGDILANGQVFLVNPNGIFFAPGATLDVQGLVATTEGIKNSDFMAGRYLFAKAPGAPDATVVNQGSIVSGPKGYVVLAGDYVENDGQINAQSGRVALAAGSGANLTLQNNQLISYVVDGATLARLAGVDNTGQITAQGGAVLMTADVANALTATAVNNSGFVAARSVHTSAGEIILSATGGGIENSGTLDASAATYGAGGGIVIIHGNGKTLLDPSSIIDTAGKGARGGYIDLSGHSLAVRGQVTTGKRGTLMLDPTTINIVSGNVAGTHSGGTNSVGTGFITSKLNSGSNVYVVAAGTVKNTSGVTITGTGGSAVLAFATGTVTAPNGIFVSKSFPTVTLATGTINLSGLNIAIAGRMFVSASQGSITLGPTAANSGLTVRGGTIQVNGNLNAGVGILSLAANRGVATGAFIKTASGVKLKGGAVDINLGGSYGGVVSVGTISATSSANLDLNYNTLQSPTSPEKIVVNGNITASRIRVSASGPKDSITINGSLSAVDHVRPAEVNITADGKGGKSLITVNGNITVSGKESSGGGSLQPFDLPTVATLKVEAIGSGTGSHVAKVKGNVDVTAVGANYNRSSTCECGPPGRDQTGIGGVAAAYIIATGSHGAASINGNLNVKGPDAHAGLFANAVNVSGNINITGSGHHVTRTVSPESAKASYTSSNSAGQATLQLGAGQPYAGSPAAATPILSKSVKVGGNIAVAGKGLAAVDILSSNVSAAGITVTAAAAKGNVKQTGITSGACTRFVNNDCTDLDSIGFYRGIGPGPLRSGTINAGRAEIRVSGGTNLGNSSSGSGALSVKLGALNVTGAGHAGVDIDAKAIHTQGITVHATKGTEKGTGSSQSGVTAATLYQHSFNINGGDAEVKMRSGGSGSGGVLTQNGGPVTIGGNVSIAGPDAMIDVKAKTILVGGTLTLTGSGGAIASDTVITPAAGSSVHTHFVGNELTLINLQGGASGSVSVAGKTTIKAPGVIGVDMLAGNVKLHGLSGSASAAVNYSVLDTRVSATANNFTAASFDLVIADVGVAGGAPAFAAASDVGDVVINSKGKVSLASEIKVGGNLNVQAGATILGSLGTVVTHINGIQNDRPHTGSHSGSAPSAAGLPHLTVSATKLAFSAGGSVSLDSTTLNGGSMTVAAVGNLNMIGASVNAANLATVTGGSIDLSGDKITVTGVTKLTAGLVTAGQALAAKDIILSGISLTTGTFEASAGGTIHNGGGPGTITANGLAVIAGKDINLSSTQLNIGAGTVAGVSGDAALLIGLAESGISPLSGKPNGAFIAGGNLVLGGLNLTGSYLYLQAANISALGKITVPVGTVVQASPFDPTATMGFENLPATVAGFNLSFQGFMNQVVVQNGGSFTLVLGNSAETGGAFIGQNGSFNIGADNLIIDTSGNVTGLENVISTGIVASLSSILGPPLPPPTSGEIDPTSSNNNNTAGSNDKKQQGQSGEDTGTGGTPGGAIGQDTGNASVCH